MYQLTTPEQTDNKGKPMFIAYHFDGFLYELENVILRAIVGDPKRHRPLAQHAAPTTTAVQEATPASMYTLETRYQPIPPKVLPQPTTAKVYYIESQREEQTTGPHPVLVH